MLLKQRTAHIALILSCPLFCTLAVNGQVRPLKNYDGHFAYITYSGAVIDSMSSEPLPGAVVSLITGIDHNVEVENYLTDSNGQFSLTARGAPSVMTRIEISCLGYKLRKLALPKDDGQIDLGKIKMSRDIHDIDAVIVNTRIRMYKIHGDTMVVYPRAVKTMTGDNLLEVLRQIPGIEVLKDGNVTVWGQMIEKTKVNGALIFGDDPRTALRTLDANSATSILIYDETDKDDEVLHGKNARKRKTADVITFDKFTSSLSGNIQLEGGADRRDDRNGNHQLRYLGDATCGHYSEKRQIEVGGNVDNRNLVTEWSKPSGYKRHWDIKTKISGRPDDKNNYSVEYEYSNDYSKTPDLTNFIYFPTAQFLSQTTENSNSNTATKANHYINLNYHHLKPSKLSINANISSNITASDLSSAYLSKTFRDQSLLTETGRTGQTTTDIYNLNSRISTDWRLGSNSIKFSIDFHVRKSDGRTIRQDSTESIGLSERKIYTIDSNVPDFGLTPGIGYTANFRNGGSLSVNSTVKYARNSSYQIAIDALTGMRDDAVSGDYTSKQTQINETIEYRINKNRHNFGIGMTYRAVFMNRDDRIPVSDKIDRYFDALLPQFTYTYSNNGNNYRLRFSSSHLVPPAKRFSNQIIDTNPMLLTAGNPGLRDSKAYQLDLNVSNTYENESFLGYGLKLSLYDKAVVTARTYYASSAILTEYDHYEVPAGATLLTYVNAGNSIEINPNIEYKVQINPVHSSFFRSVFSLTADYTYTNPQEGVDNRLLRTHQHAGGIKLSLTSNSSRIFRTEILNSTKYHWFKNGNGSSDKGVWETAGINLRVDFLKRLYFSGSYTFEYIENTHSLTIGNHTLNASAGCRVFKDRKGIISFNAYDILDKTSNFTSFVNNQYISNVWQQLFAAYFSLSFEYRFNNMK